MEKLLSTEEVLQKLGIKKSTLYAWTSQNKIPYIKLGKRILKFRENEIEQWLEKSSVQPGEKHSTQKAKKRSRPKASLKTYNELVERMICSAKKEVLK